MEFYIGKSFPDNEYGEAQIIELKMQKRFRAKDQKKDDVLQEDLDNNSEYTTDDETVKLEEVQAVYFASVL